MILHCFTSHVHVHLLILLFDHFRDNLTFLYNFSLRIFQSNECDFFLYNTNLFHSFFPTNALLSLTFTESDALFCNRLLLISSFLCSPFTLRLLRSTLLLLLLLKPLIYHLHKDLHITSTHTAFFSWIFVELCLTSGEVTLLPYADLGGVDQVADRNGPAHGGPHTRMTGAAFMHLQQGEVCRWAPSHRHHVVANSIW